MLRDPIVEAAEMGGYVLDGFPRTLLQAEEAYRLFDTQTTGKAVILPS